MSFRLARRSIALAMTALAMTASAAGAQSYTVTSTADTVDATPANGVCEAPCTLRGAIQTANGAGAPAADTIALPAGTYNFTIGGADGADPVSPWPSPRSQSSIVGAFSTTTPSPSRRPTPGVPEGSWNETRCTGATVSTCAG